ncbi:MAG: hypothetical protein QOE77_910 [Blastocatellia bacterium]|jgi:hypothetical protein|nr:hypothetical protein [Blastocatellia bacterium]
MADSITAQSIPYVTLAEKLFRDDAANGQEFIPFLGAGVSISGRKFGPRTSLKSPPPDRAEIDQAIAGLRLEGKGKTFIEMAILLAYLVQLEEQNGPLDTEPTFSTKLENDEYPPSAGELAQLFSLRSSYTSFSRIAKSLAGLFPDQLLTSTLDDQVAALQLLARVTRIAYPPEALTSITSYFEKSMSREDLWNLLYRVFEKKKRPTATHELLAEAASYHLGQDGAIDYLIITTNYDSLMETALDALQVPYIVLTTKRGNDRRVLMHCSETVKGKVGLEKKYNNTTFSKDFTVMKSQSVVIIYKMHGSLGAGSTIDDEGLVISDNDYVDYVTQMSKAEGVIPVHVSTLMNMKSLWFLGYSLSDWNVRSIYETIKRKSNPNNSDRIRDYSVMYSVGDFEKLFFDKNNIQIYEASLNDFVGGIVANLPMNLRACAYPKA